MSKPKHDWWSYVKGMIRRYPQLKADHEALRSQNLTQSLSGMPSGGGKAIKRPVEDLLGRGLSGISLRELNAVEDAIWATEGKSNGKGRMELVRLVFWERTHDIAGAALVVHCSEITAKRWHRDFILLVGKNFGFFER